MKHAAAAPIVVLLAILALVSACDDKRRHDVTKGLDFAAVEAPVADDAPAIQVARALVTALADAQNARAQGFGSPEKKTLYDQAMARLWNLVDRDEIFNQVKLSRSVTFPKDVQQKAAVTVILESWVSMVAHYAGGINLEEILVVPPNPESSATAYLRATNPREEETLGEIEKEIAGTPAPAPTTREAEERADKIRSRSLIEGISPPAVSGIEVRLRKGPLGWRASRLSIGNPMPFSLIPKTSVPTSSAPSVPLGS